MSSKYLNDIDQLSNSAGHLHETTKFTNLNTDCMELVFNHLELNDLLSVADSSKVFHAPICQVFKKKFLNKNIVFDLERNRSRG